MVKKQTQMALSVYIFHSSPKKKGKRFFSQQTRMCKICEKFAKSSCAYISAKKCPFSAAQKMREIVVQNLQSRCVDKFAY